MHACNVCGKELSSSSSLAKHRAKKIPCKTPTRLIAAALEAAGRQTDTEFRENTVKLNRELSKETRAAEGIYITPKKARDALFGALGVIEPNSKILEPSFGTGEFILDLLHTFAPNATVYGVEKNKALFDSINAPTAKLFNADFLEWTSPEMFDVILGNPPYFVLKDAGSMADECMTGRPNIYVLFLYKCLTQHLKNGGRLAFIIPTSLYNAAYYQKMRDWIASNTRILHVETLDKPGFYQTGQETTLIVLQKGVAATDFLFRGVNDQTYITPHWKRLRELVAGSTTLRALGASVKTGAIVWNQVKDSLTSDEKKGILLIYSSNIENSTLVLNNLRGDVKKQYVSGMKKEPLKGQYILVERGYGNSFKFNAVLTDLSVPFYAENHVNVISSDDPAVLARIMKSLKDERTCEFVRLFLANGSMSATDLETLVPIW